MGLQLGPVDIDDLVLVRPMPWVTVVDEDGCRVRKTEVHISETDVSKDAVLAELLACPAFERDRALGYTARRLTCAFGEPGLSYRYSGITKRPVPWPPLTRALADAVGRRLGIEFNFCLANLYPDHTATLGWHADDERDLEPGAPIAIVSLGSPRLLGLQRVADGHTQSIELRHGSLLVMEGDTQRKYRHCICKGNKDDGPRVSLTLRRVRA